MSTTTPPSKPLNFLVIGAGSRGTAYARAVAATFSQDLVRFVAVADPDPFKRQAFGRNFIWGTRANPCSKPKCSQSFEGWREWIAWEDARRANADSRSENDHPQDLDADVGDDVVVTGAFVCTLDESHKEILMALAHLNLHVLCEKPLALSLEDCLDIQGAYSIPGNESSSKPIGHRRDANSANSTNNSSSSSGSPITSPSGSNSSSSSSSPKITSSSISEMGKQAPLQQKIFSLGHVLRYSPHNILLRKLLLHDRAIGDVVSLEHTEPVGWWHFTHSYVRGNWRRHTISPSGTPIGTLLTKSCHDIDFIMWLLSSPANSTVKGAKVHLPATVSSHGQRALFRSSRKPRAAGNATNCTACPLAEEGCAFSAVKIYRDRMLRQQRDTGWPLKVVVPDIEDIVSAATSPEAGLERAEEALMANLAEDYHVTSTEASRIHKRSWYGRCVYESDNDVVEDQAVTITWDEEEEKEEEEEEEEEADYLITTTTTTTNTHQPKPLPHHGSHIKTPRGPKTALFHLTFATHAQCDRRGRIHGTAGEITYDSRSITVYTFADECTIVHTLPDPHSVEAQNHGGGDLGLAGAFVQAVQAVEGRAMDAHEAQMHFVGGDLEEMVRSHVLVFAAEEARSRGEVVRLSEWWGREGEKEGKGGKEREREMEVVC